MAGGTSGHLLGGALAAALVGPYTGALCIAVLLSLDVTVLMVTHDLPYALQLCPRSVVLSGGVIAADGTTGAMLADEDLLAAHRLELPYGFTVAAAQAVASG